MVLAFPAADLRSRTAAVDSTRPGRSVVGRDGQDAATAPEAGPGGLPGRAAAQEGLKELSKSSERAP